MGKICTYCSQSGHTAAHCPRRASEPSQRRLNAEAAFNAVRRRPLSISRRRTRKVEPERYAAWQEDLKAIIAEMDAEIAASTDRMLERMP